MTSFFLNARHCFLALAFLAAAVSLSAQVTPPQTPSENPAPAAAQSLSQNLAPEAPVRASLSTRVVAYQIDARLDPVKKTVTATELLTYRNLTGQPLSEFPFHLYLNAFQPQSTFMRELRRDNPPYEWRPENFGAIEVKSLEVVGMGDLRSQMHFIQPDDNNFDDHTVMEVRLPRPVPPGGEVQFRIAFVDQLPRIVARTGYLRDFFMVAQWFPKVGVWWKGAWNCHQFHESTEFFADFGVFDVKVTVPQKFITGASADEVSSVNNSDGTKTVTFHSEDVHDFCWTASRHFTLVEDSWTGSAGTVKIRMLMSPDHMASAPRYLGALKGTMTLFDEWYGPYPYGRITVVDPPHGAYRAGGMEYPTLITADTSWLMPRGILIPEDVVVHEFAHQYWYGMVATNEFEEAWLDEGITSYCEDKIMDALYGSGRSFVNIWGATFSETQERRLEYIGHPDTDPIARLGFQFLNESAYGSVTYGKTATMLQTLEKIIGEDTLRRAMRAYFLRYRFTHPTGEDFLKTIEEVSGKDLRWYFDQAVYGAQVFDYRIFEMHSDPANWFEERASREKGKSPLFRSTVVVHRRGDFIFPVDLQVRFENGETAQEHWDGRDRWIRYTYVKPSRILSAEIDPGNNIGLDRNQFNNSSTAAVDTRAKRKLANFWMFFCQLLAQAVAWLT